MGNPRTDWMMSHRGRSPVSNGRALGYPRGKVLGGCTAINGMIYMRGQAADYDHWRQLGNAGWGWEDVLALLPPLRGQLSRQTPTCTGAGGEWKVAPAAAALGHPRGVSRRRRGDRHSPPPVAARQFSIAAMITPATSSACTWWTVSRPKLGSVSRSPRARVEKTAGLKLPAGLSGAHPGPTICPG